jgi:hypothetical protein
VAARPSGCDPDRDARIEREDGSFSGLVDASTGQALAPLEDVPPGVEVGMDGAWALDSGSRLTRPAILSALGAGSVALLAWTTLEMGRQI